MPRVRAKHRQQGYSNDKIVHVASRWANSNDHWLAEFTVFAPFCMQEKDVPCWYMLCYNPSGTIKICKLGYYNGMFGAWPQKTPDRPVLASGLDDLMPFINMPYMLYQNALSSNVSLVTIEVETSGSYTAKPHEISGLPASDHLVPVSMPFGSDLCVVAYNKNKIALYKIDRDQKKADLLIHPQTWVSGWTTFAPLADGYSFVCLNAKTGAIGGVQVAPDQMRLHIAEGHPLPGYNALAGLVGSEPFFVAYANSNNLAPQIFSIQWQDPLKLNPKPSEDWPPNINWIATFEVAEKIDKPLVYFLIHQTSATSALTRSTAPSLAGTSSSLTISSGVKPGYPDPPPPPHPRS